MINKTINVTEICICILKSPQNILRTDSISWFDMVVSPSPVLMYSASYDWSMNLLIFFKLSCGWKGSNWSIFCYFYFSILHPQIFLEQHLENGTKYASHQDRVLPNAWHNFALWFHPHDILKCFGVTTHNQRVKFCGNFQLLNKLSKTILTVSVQSALRPWTSR